MATSDSSKAEAAAAARQAKTEDAEEVTGIATAFRGAAEFGPQVISLGQAILDGIAGAQRREAARLARRDKDDPRIADALARAERSAAISAEALAVGTAGGRILEVFRTDGLFQGYVLQADSAPAVGYTVQLRGVAGLAARLARAKTDADGYFSMSLGVGDTAGVTNRSLQTIVENLSAIGETAPKPAEPSAGGKASTTDVEVLDPSGLAVLRDDAPPDFTEEKSAFRYYLLPATTRGSQTPSPDTKAPETKDPDTQAPDTKIPETKAADTRAPDPKASDTKTPATRPGATTGAATRASTTKARDIKG